jgi:hypothetical protein
MATADRDLRQNDTEQHSGTHSLEQFAAPSPEIRLASYTPADAETADKLAALRL